MSMAEPSESCSASDPYDLERFLRAHANVYEQALAEIRAGQKRSHWMWYIFPQIDGLGFSTTSKYYAIKSIDEAQALLDHPVLGPRLRECTGAVLSLEGRSALQIFGSTDAMKLHSSATLFASVASPGSVFEQVLEKYYGGRRDEQTLRLLGRI